jgi:hypothetical protein
MSDMVKYRSGDGYKLYHYLSVLYESLYRLIILSICAGLSIHCQAQDIITFRVDMNNPFEAGLYEPSTGDRVILRGTFNKWTGDDFVLEEQEGDHIWSGKFRIEQIRNLILDLRGNDRGDPFCAVPLLSYLEHEPVPYYEEPYGRYAEFAEPIPIEENHFSGNLYTLLDGYCGSTNGHFCALLKYNRIGKFVGTPGGATYKCNAGRDTEISLDHTGMILTFGRTTYAAVVKGMDKTEPVMPDYPVQVTYEDFLNGRDVFLETAMKLIE